MVGLNVSYAYCFSGAEPTVPVGSSAVVAINGQLVALDTDGYVISVTQHPQVTLRR